MTCSKNLLYVRVYAGSNLSFDLAPSFPFHIVETGISRNRALVEKIALALAVDWLSIR